MRRIIVAITNILSVREFRIFYITIWSAAYMRVLKGVYRLNINQQLSASHVQTETEILLALITYLLVHLHSQLKSMQTTEICRLHSFSSIDALSFQHCLYFVPYVRLYCKAFDRNNITPSNSGVLSHSQHNIFICVCLIVNDFSSQ